jgi:glycosyltransferase involved in cell wall biosynthesis
MRILLINKYWRAAGGVEVHAFDVKRWLEARGHTVEPFAMLESDTAEATYSEIFPREVDFRGDTFLKSVKGLARATISKDSRSALRKVLDDFKPEAAYVLHVYHQLGTVLLNDLRAAGIPTVLSLHDYKVACANYRLYSERTGTICTKCLDSNSAPFYAPISEGCWGGSRVAGAALVAESIMTRARRSYNRPQVVTVLNDLQNSALKVAGVDDAKVVRIPHPVTLHAERENYGGNHFLYLGRLVPEKGVDVLIRAAAAAKVSLRVVGDGRQRIELEELARDVGADVQFLGSASREEVRRELADARALVVPSTWHEVSPLVVYEAIASDVPVVATRVGGMVDQLDDNRGFLVEAGSVEALAGSLREVVRDPEIARLRSRNARKHASIYWTQDAWDQNMRDAFAQAGVDV